jgi:DNA modification methylase
MEKPVVTNDYALYNGDCIEVMRQLPDESVHLTVYSPPFGGLYNYSSDPRDMSNNDSYQGFFDHYDFLLKEKFRVTMKGRMSAVHCSDIPSGNSGKDHMIDFPGDLIRAHEKNGFKYVARFCIWKEPLRVRNRTMAKCLAHQTIVQDASYCSNAGADYLLLFRKTGDNPVPIENPNGFLSYAGERQMPEELKVLKGYEGKQTENRFSHWIWRQYASCFWDDIRIDNVLPYKESKEEDDEKHVHPLQLDVIERAVQIWSKKGEIVLTPFMGVGSEVFGAVKHGRKGIGIELKGSYFKQAMRNLEMVDKSESDLNTAIFDMMK